MTRVPFHGSPLGWEAGAGVVGEPDRSAVLVDGLDLGAADDSTAPSAASSKSAPPRSQTHAPRWPTRPSQPDPDRSRTLHHRLLVRMGDAGNCREAFTHVSGFSAES